jgi:hypothetical protein
MPQESLITSLAGQAQTTSTEVGADNSSTIFEFGSEPLGASQKAPAPETAKVLERPMPPLATAIRLQPPLETKLWRRVSTLQTRQLWEGTVSELRNDAFTAVLTDKTNPQNPDEQAVFHYSELSPEDRRLAEPGSSFYWIIGSERTVGGQLKNVSIVQFRRVPAWTRSALARASDRAKLFREVFRPHE